MRKLVGLYAGDGDKNDKSVGFANSDSKIIEFMMGWFRDFCGVDEDRFRGRIWLHDELNVENAKLFWSRLTGIPVMQFYKTYVTMVKSGSKKVRKNRHQYGVFSIRISNSDLQRKIKGWMSSAIGMCFEENL